MADFTNRNITENLCRYLTRPNNGQAILIEGPWGCGKTHFINTFIGTFIKNEKSKNLKPIKISLFGLNSIAEVENRVLGAFYPVLENKLVKLATVSAKKISAKIGLDYSGDGKPDAQATFSADKINLYTLLIEGRNDFALILDDIERTNIKPQELLGYINHIVETCQIRTILIANESELWKHEDDDYNKFKEKVISRTFHVVHDAEAVIEHFLKGRNSPIKKFKPFILEAYTITRSRNLRSLQQVIDDFLQLYEQLDSTYKEHEQYTNALAKTFFSLGLSIKCSSTKKKDLQSGDILKSSSAFMKEYFSTGRPVLSEDFWVRALFYSDYSTLNAESSKQHFFYVSPTSEVDTLDRLRNFEDLEDEEFKTLLTQLESEVKHGTNQPPHIYIKKAAMLATLIQHKLSDINLQVLASNINSYIRNNQDLDEWKQTRPERLSQYEAEHLGAAKNLIKKYESFYAHWNSTYDAEQLKQGAEQKESKASAFYQALKDNNRDALARILITENSHTAFLTTLNAEYFAQALLEAPNAAINRLIEIMGNRYHSYLPGSNSSRSLPLEIEFWDQARRAIEVRLQDAKPLKKHNLEKFVDPVIANFHALLSVGIDTEQE